VWRNRLLAAGLVGLLLALMRLLAPQAIQRQEWLYLIALPIGYGHLLGAARFARSRRAAGPSSLLTMAFGGASVLNLLVGYTWALHTPALQMAVLVPMLLVSAWHIAENDLALGRSYRDDLRLGRVPRAIRHHALAAAWTAGVGLLALSTRSGVHFAMLSFGGPAVPLQTAFTIDELATAILLYHAVSWILFFEDRARALPEVAAGHLRKRLLWLHAIPLALNAALYLWVPAVHFYVAAPTLYLFWSVLHAFQTAFVRGLEPRACARVAWARS
jgi:hypothetical protein